MGRRRVDDSTPAKKTIQDPVFLSVDYTDARSGTGSAGGDVNALHLRSRHGEGTHTVVTPWRLALYQVWEIGLYELSYR